MARHSGEKAERLRAAIAQMPRQPGEEKKRWCHRLATAAGCTVQYAAHVATIIEYEAIGAKLRAEEQAARLERDALAARELAALGRVENFRDWFTVFGKLGLCVELLLEYARRRGDRVEESFLKDVRDICERAQRRLKPT